MNVLEDETLRKAQGYPIGWKQHQGSPLRYPCQPLIRQGILILSPRATGNRAEFIIDDDEDEGNDDAQSD